MPQIADAVANRFLDIAGEQGAKISPMKIQKLVYFAHGWHLAISGEPLITELVQAWKFGPVIQSLYREFKEFGNDPISRHAREVRLINGEIEAYAPQLENELPNAVVQRVWNQYGKFTAIQLSNLTHEPGSPWHQVASGFPGGLPRGLNIPNEIIRDFFRANARASARA